MANFPQAAERFPSAKPLQESSTRKLVVGEGITLSGQITACDCLVVEGTVKADIKGCKEVQIAKGGVFIGSAASEQADIHGRFQGELNVSQHLKVQSTGEIDGKVRYRQIQVESGGDISGDIRAIRPGKPDTSPGPN
jgi:cytoskeletal protein CcmA (bactofilin family)